jgi:aminoglycoside phosphotransferase (APT) family kinase protein
VSDEAELGEDLAEWLATQVDGAVRLGSCRRPGSGMSNDTLLVEAAWGGTTRRIVVRLTPSGRPLFPRYDLGAQAAVLHALHEHTSVPVPRVLWWEPDPAPVGRPFYVMEHVDGRIPPDAHLFTGWLKDLDPPDQAALLEHALDVLARIHRVDVGTVAELEVLDRPEHATTPLDQELAWWRAYLDWAAAGDRLPRLEDAYTQLLDARPPDAEVARGLVWGDARLGNLVVDDALRPVAVLDWEMAVLGPPELDLGWYLFLERTARQFAPQLPGFPEPDELVARYEVRLGRPLRHLAWFEAWSGFRTACIQVRLAENPADRERNPVTKALRACLAAMDGAG